MEGWGGLAPLDPLTGFLALWPLFGVPRQGWRGRHPPAFPMQPHDTRTPSSYPQPRLLAMGHVHLAVLCCIQGLSLPSATTARGGAGSPGSQPLGAPPNSRDTCIPPFLINSSTTAVSTPLFSALSPSPPTDAHTCHLRTKCQLIVASESKIMEFLL